MKVTRAMEGADPLLIGAVDATLGTEEGQIEHLLHLFRCGTVC